MSTEFQGAIVSWVNQVNGSHDVADFSDLGDGVAFIAILGMVSPDHFDGSRMKTNAQGNSILKKANLDKLIESLSGFLNDAQSGLNNFNVADHVDSSTAEEDRQELAVLASFVFTVVVTSGGPDLMKHVRGLPKPEQMALQAEAKKLMGTHNIKKAPVPGVRSAGSSNSSPVPDSANGGDGGINGAPKVFGHSHHHHDPTAMIDENKKLNEQLTHSNSQLAEAHAAHEELKQNFDELDRKYKKTLDQGSVGQSAKERELYDRLDEKGRELLQLEGTLSGSRRDIETLTKSQEQLKDQKENLLREVAQLQDNVERERKGKQEALDAASMAQDKTASNIKRREELEDEVSKITQEKKVLDEKYVARKAEVEERNQVVADLQRASQKHKKELSGLQEKIQELEASHGLASNFGAQGGASGDGSDDLREEILELRRQRSEDAGAWNSKKKILEDQVSLLQEKLLEEGEVEPVVDTAAVEKAQALAREWERKHELLQQHLQESVASNSDLRVQLQEVKASALALSEKHDQAQANTQQHDAASVAQAEQVHKQNEELKERIKNAKAAAKVEQAAIFSAFFECGHRSLQVQQRQLMGPPSVPSGTLFDLGSEEGTRGLSFMEKQRRSIEHSMLLNLATPVSSGARGYK